MQRPLILAPIALAAVLATACGGSSSSPSAGSSNPPSNSPSAAATAPANPAAAKAEITLAWKTFFNSGTPTAIAKSLLEDGDSLGPALRIAQQEDRASKLDRKAKVKLISFLNANTANVTWVLLNGTTPLLANASGQSVYVDGKWKVSKTTFCTLVMLGANGKPVPGCSP